MQLAFMGRKTPEGQRGATVGQRGASVHQRADRALSILGRRTPDAQRGATVARPRQRCQVCKPARSMLSRSDAVKHALLIGCRVQVFRAKRNLLACNLPVSRSSSIFHFAA